MRSLKAKVNRPLPKRETERDRGGGGGGGGRGAKPAVPGENPRQPARLGVLLCHPMLAGWGCKPTVIARVICKATIIKRLQRRGLKMNAGRRAHKARLSVVWDRHTSKDMKTGGSTEIDTARWGPPQTSTGANQAYDTLLRDFSWTSLQER